MLLTVAKKVVGILLEISGSDKMKEIFANEVVFSASSTRFV